LPAPATANPATVTTITTVKAASPPPPAKPVQPEQATRPVKVASASAMVPAPAAQELAAKPHTGWLIQVGAFDTETEAKDRLTAAQGNAKEQLAQASPFTEPVAKGDKTLYRARFAGLDKNQAEAACKNLKRSEIPCMLLKN
jgi:D-alanyl-D-alanine carboxypeptidase